MDKLDGELGKIIFETKEILLNSPVVSEEKPEEL